MDDKCTRYPDSGKTDRRALTRQAVISFIAVSQPAWGTVAEESQEGSDGIVTKEKNVKTRAHAAPEPLLLLPAPQTIDAGKAASSVEPPHNRLETDVLSFKPRSADERAEDFLIDWVRRFSRA